MHRCIADSGGMIRFMIRRAKLVSIAVMYHENFLIGKREWPGLVGGVQKRQIYVTGVGFAYQISISCYFFWGGGGGPSNPPNPTVCPT